MKATPNLVQSWQPEMLPLFYVNDARTVTLNLKIAKHYESFSVLCIILNWNCITKARIWTAVRSSDKSRRTAPVSCSPLPISLALKELSALEFLRVVAATRPSQIVYQCDKRQSGPFRIPAHALQHLQITCLSDQFFFWLDSSAIQALSTCLKWPKTFLNCEKTIQFSRSGNENRLLHCEFH